MDKIQTERIGVSYSYVRRWAEMDERKTIVHVKEETHDGSIVDRTVCMTLAEKRIIDSIAMRLYAEHERYIQKSEDEEGIKNLTLRIRVELPDGVLPETKA